MGAWDSLPEMDGLSFALVLLGLAALWLALRVSALRQAEQEGTALPLRSPPWLQRLARRPGVPQVIWALALLLLAAGIWRTAQ